MVILEDMKKCCGCSSCFNICPVSCITVERDEDGFYYPRINEEICISCRKCKTVCPVLNPPDLNGEPEVYAVYHLREEVRKESSSGGAFYYFAEQVLNRGGVVFGASFDEQYRVVYEGVQTIDGIRRLMGSKYVESRVGETYREVQGYLEAGRYVLFAGTPCHAAGLKAYLKKEYKKLLLIDFICHGVPSSGVWEEYLNTLNSGGKRIKGLSFRDKKRGWREFSFKIEFECGEMFHESARKNYYMQAFLKNFDLRDSCHACDFKGERRASDITLADFWGIEEIDKELAEDDRGLSMLLLNTGKGKEFFDAAEKKQLFTKKIPEAGRAIRNNSASVMSVPKNKKREDFFDLVKKQGAFSALKRYGRTGINEKIGSVFKTGMIRLIKFAVEK